MPGPLANLVLERANAPGTAATFNLGGAPSGWVGFVAGIGNGATAYYYMSDGVQAEWGHGVVTAGAINTLARNVIGNSQGTTARLNFTGAVDVWCEVPAERTPFFDSANTTLPMGGRRLAGLGAGTAGDDGARLDQLGRRKVAEVTVASAQVSAIFSLPAGLNRFVLEWEDLVLSASGNLGLQFSVDNGATFRGGTSDYAWLLRDARGPTGSTDYNGVGGLLFVGLNTVNAQFGEAVFSRARQVISRNFAVQGSPAAHSVTHGGGASNYAGSSSHVALLGTGANITAGRIRLLGA